MSHRKGSLPAPTTAITTITTNVATAATAITISATAVATEQEPHLVVGYSWQGKKLLLDVGGGGERLV